MIRICSWNVNGLRSVLKKDGILSIKSIDADIICLQETRVSETDHPKLDLPEYKYCYWNEAQKKGYSGTAILSKIQPKSVFSDITNLLHKHPAEGRVVTLEFSTFYLLNVYVPNSQRGLARLEYRDKEWDPDLLNFINTLNKTKPVIACGDFNVAHEEMDLARPNANRKNAGFTDIERNNFTKLLNAGYVDTFRHLHPNTKDKYSWWSYMHNAREKNIGWRIDYFLVSQKLKNQIQKADILDNIQGSDHAPIILQIDLT